MMDDPDYMEKTIHKIRTYAKNDIIQGVNLILTFETGRIPLDPREIQKLIDQFLK